MSYNNYSISYSKGKLYVKSAEPKEGYEKITYGTANDKTTYHKYSNSIKGVLKYFDVKEITHDNRKLSFLEVTLVDGEENNKLSVPLKNNVGGYTDEVKALVSALNTAEVGEEYTLQVAKSNSTGANGKEYTNLNVYLNYVNRLGENGKGLSTGFISFNDVPRPEKEEDEDLGTTWNWKPVNKFYAQKIKEISTKFGNTSSETSTPSSNNSTNTPAPSKPTPTQNPAPVKTKIPTATAAEAFEPIGSNNEPFENDLPF